MCPVLFLILAYVFSLLFLEFTWQKVIYFLDMFPFLSFLYFWFYYTKECKWYNFYIIESIKVIFMFLHVIKLYNYSTDKHFKIIYVVYRVENLYILEIQ